MDAAKRSKLNKNVSKPSRFKVDKELPTAEDALKKYHDKMFKLELKLKSDLEFQRMRRQGLGANNLSDSEDDLLFQKQESVPSKYTVAGEEMLKGIRANRMKIHNEAEIRDAGLESSEYYDKNFNIKAKDLIMMNVPEKKDFLEKREKYLKKKQLESGITNEALETLKARKMVPADLKFLPACEVKDILEGRKGRDSNNKNKAAKPADQYSENIKVSKREVEKVRENVASDKPFEGGYIAEFSRNTLKEHNKLTKDYQTEMLNRKIEEQGSMYGRAAMEVSDKVLELRANCQISKVNSMFEDHKISVHYERFQEKAMMLIAEDVRQEEETEAKRVEEQEKKRGVGAFKARPKRFKTSEAASAHL